MCGCWVDSWIDVQVVGGGCLVTWMDVSLCGLWFVGNMDGSVARLLVVVWIHEWICRLVGGGWLVVWMDVSVGVFWLGV